MSIVFNGMGGPRWGGFCEPHAWFPTRVGGPLGCGLCEPHVWVFQLAWVGRSGAGLGTCWRGSLVQFSLYRVPRGCGFVNKVMCPTRMGRLCGGGVNAFVYPTLERAVWGVGLYPAHVCADARTRGDVCPRWGRTLRACASLSGIALRHGGGACEGQTSWPSLKWTGARSAVDPGIRRVATARDGI